VSLKRFIQLLISIILLSVLIYWIDFRNFINSIKNANYFYILFAILIVTINRFIMAYKWNLLLKVKDINISFFEVTKIYYISNFLGLYLPPTIGADIVRAYYINKKEYQLSDIFSSIVVERVIGLLVLLVFAVLGGIFFYLFFLDSRINIQHILNVFILITFFVFLVFILSLNKTISAKILMLLERHNSDNILGKLMSKLEKLYISYLLFRNSKVILLLFFLLTGLEVFSYILRSYVVAQALNVEIPFIYIFSFVPIIMALIRLPISLNGFGINEGGFVYFLSLIEVPKAVGFSVGLIDHLVVMIAILPGGLLYLFDQGFKNQIEEKNTDR
jgi:glycosyltransferase 2 family protein